MARVSKFLGGSSPVYTCRMCGKATRETGDGESSVELCVVCYEIAGLENEIADDGPNAAVEAKIAALKAKVGIA